MIYVAEIMGGKWIKLGFSEEETCRLRIAQLQTGNPFEIKLLFVIPGTLMQEQALHSALRITFGRIRVPMPPNEWYPGPHPVFQGFLADLRFGMDAGIAYLDRFNPSVRQAGQKANSSTKPNIRWP